MPWSTAAPGSETPIEVRVKATPQGVRAEIEHAGPEFEARPRPDEQHYGLFLVEQIADRWGVEPLGARNRAWFEVSSRLITDSASLLSHLPPA